MLPCMVQHRLPTQQTCYSATVSLWCPVFADSVPSCISALRQGRGYDSLPLWPSVLPSVDLLPLLHSFIRRRHPHPHQNQTRHPVPLFAALHYHPTVPRREKPTAATTHARRGREPMGRGGGQGETTPHHHGTACTRDATASL